MMDRYNIAVNDKDGKKKLLSKMLEEYRECREKFFDDISSASRAAKSLEEIALRQSFLTNVTYIERLIKSEETSSRPNKSMRLQQLHHFIQMALTLREVRTNPNRLTTTVSNYEATILEQINKIKDEVEHVYSPFRLD